MNTKRKWLGVIVSVLLATFLVGSATGVQRTVLSVYSKSIVGAAFLAFLPLVTFGLFKGTIDLVAGILSDKVGRRKTLLLGVTAYTCGASAIALVTSYETLVLGNMLIGLGQGLVFSSSMIALSDIYGAEEAATSFGLMESFTYWGYGIGSLLAGIIWQFYGVPAAFMYSMVAAMAALTTAVIGARETKSLIKLERRAAVEEEVKSVWEAYRICLKNVSLVVTYMAAHIAKFVDALAWAALPLLFASRHYSDVEIGILQGAVTFFWATSMPVWGMLSDRVGRKALIFTGLALNAAALLAMLHTVGFIPNLIACIIVGVSIGMYYPIIPAISVDLTPLAVKGRAIGLYRSLRDYGYFTGALVIGCLLDVYGMATGFYVASSLALISAILVLLLVRETKPAWPFFDLILDHAEKMIEILRLNGEFIKALAEKDLARAEELADRIKRIEREADTLKRRIMSRIWSTTIPIGDRMDFERLTEVIDRVAGCILESHERLLRVNPDVFTPEITSGLLEMNRLTLETAERFVENVRALKTSPVYAIKLADEVERAETRVDEVRKKLLDELRKMVESGKVDLLTAIDMHNAVDLIENVADDFEDASDIVRVISYKHVG